MDMLWFKNIPIIWISAGIPLTIVGVYFLVKFFDRTNRIDEKQRQQIALNEAKIERIKNENYENIQRNSNSSGWISSIYFLIFLALLLEHSKIGTIQKITALKIIYQIHPREKYYRIMS